MVAILKIVPGWVGTPSEIEATYVTFNRWKFHKISKYAGVFLCGTQTKMCV